LLQLLHLPARLSLIQLLGPAFQVFCHFLPGAAMMLAANVSQLAIPFG